VHPHITLAGALCALMLAATDARGAVAFSAGQPESLVGPPAFIAAGDLDRDGDLDLVAVSATGKELQVFLAVENTPTKLLARGTLRFGEELRRATVGDVNGDGIADLACADLHADGVWVLIGRGDGSFRDPYLVAAGSDPVDVATADIDGHNGRDLIVADVRRGTAIVLLNDGAMPPGFQHATDVSLGEGPERVLAIDVNRDRRPDIVTLNLGARVKEVAISRLQGLNGVVPEFEATPQRVAVGDKPSELITAELTGDAAPDLALLNRHSAGEEVVVLRNDGSGRFTPSTTQVGCPFFTGGSPCRLLALAAADFNRNNRTDLVVALDDPRRTVDPGHPTDAAQILSTGDGRFVTGPVLAVAQSPVAVIVGKLTGDCMPELVVASQRTASLQVFVNTSTPTGSAGNGERCVRSQDCLSGYCTDARCCVGPCGVSERCDVPGHEGVCLPVTSPLMPCELDRNCRSSVAPFCVDGICCNEPCPTGRCDRRGFEGVCVPGSPVGESCGEDRECESGNCSRNFVCCNEPCDDGFCDGEGLCQPLRPLAERCDVDEQCSSGVCDVFEHICCNRRCEDDQFCGFRGLCGPGGAEMFSVAPTLSRVRDGANLEDDGTTCRADCDGDDAIAIGELIRLVALALGIPASDCPAADPASEGCVTIDQIVFAVNEALIGCDRVTPAP
jgi:hypothetical protein